MCLRCFIQMWTFECFWWYSFGHLFVHLFREQKLTSQFQNDFTVYSGQTTENAYVFSCLSFRIHKHTSSSCIHRKLLFPEWTYATNSLLEMISATISHTHKKNSATQLAIQFNTSWHYAALHSRGISEWFRTVFRHSNSPKNTTFVLYRVLGYRINLNEFS